jgi:cytoskeletal protein CcmA (bactofilin family)
MEADKPTVVDAEADLEGKLQGKDARILGRFRGEIELTGRLHVGEGARVDAKVRSDSAEIAGEYKGDLSARSLLLLERAKVAGVLVAETLAVRDGAVVNANVSAGKPAKGGKPGPGAAQG